MPQCNITAPSDPADCAAFTVAHGFGGVPSELPSLIMTSLGEIVYQSAIQFDGTYLYLVASAPGLTAVGKLSTGTASVVTGGPYPKIVYPSGGGTTLNFTWPPRNVSAPNSKGQRYVDYSSYGDVVEFAERVDHFVDLDMPQIQSGADQAAWKAFFDWVEGGGGYFDYYPSANVNSFSTYHIPDTVPEVTRRAPGLYQFTRLRMRLKIS